ncbi:hypothetical protein STTU_0813 [Streptomyces sp. Tu6071]|nr:hypothetical protein STTU_0813 [Streptomyces sp. Tu6071]
MSHQPRQMRRHQCIVIEPKNGQANMVHSVLRGGEPRLHPR